MGGKDERIGRCDARSMGRLCAGFGGNFGEIGLSIVKPIARFVRLTYGSICLQGENACEKNC